MPVENSPTPDIVTDTASTAPQHSRRTALKTGIKYVVLIGGLEFAVEVGINAGQILRVIAPGPFSQETNLENNHNIVLTPEQLKKGIKIVVFGDSIPYGFQGYVDENGNRVEKPPTPFADFMEEAIESADLGKVEVDIRAVPGATGEDIYKQVVEYRNQVEIAKKQGTFDDRPTLFIYSMNGNSYREIMSNPEVYQQAQDVDKSGFANPEVLNLIPPFNQISESDMQYAYDSFNEIAGIASDGVKVLGLNVLGPYDFGGVPNMQFIPVQTDTDRHHGALVPITNYNLGTNEPARKGVHLVSLATNKSIVAALNTFLSQPNAANFPVLFTSMLGLETQNNGTEHLSMYGCYLLSCLLLKTIYLQLKFGRRLNLLDETQPVPPFPEIRERISPATA